MANLSEGIQNNSNQALDKKYLNHSVTPPVPYVSKAEACSIIPKAYRSIGLTVRVGTPSVSKEHHWGAGLEDVDLVEKTGGGGASSISYNSATGVLTYTDAVGTVTNIDLPIENLFQNASYNSASQTLTITTNGGGSVNISLADLVDLPEIQVSASSNPGVNPTSGQKLFLRADNGNFWIAAGGIWAGPFIGVSAAEKTAWNNKAEGVLSGGYQPAAVAAALVPGETLENSLSKLDKRASDNTQAIQTAAQDSITLSIFKVSNYATI